jgi:predicted phage tail protein
MAEIRLHGALGARFGEEHWFDVASPREVLRALAVNFPDFPEAIKDGHYQILRGEIDLDLDELDLRGQAPIHIVPVAQGAGGGRGKAVLGVALAGAAVIATGGTAAGLSATAFTALGSTVSWGNIALFGATMALTGISQMMAKPPALSGPASGRSESLPSHMFNGPVNLTEQGAPLPLIYGRVRVGSIAVSGSISTEDVSPTEASVGGGSTGSPPGLTSVVINTVPNGEGGVVYEATIEFTDSRIDPAAQPSWFRVEYSYADSGSESNLTVTQNATPSTATYVTSESGSFWRLVVPINGAHYSSDFTVLAGAQAGGPFDLTVGTRKSDYMPPSESGSN